MPKPKPTIKKIEKILSDNQSSINEFDIVFLIDSTASMGPYIEAAKSESKNISRDLRKLYPEMNFQYGYIFYRDPIDSKDDIHEIINLTDQVNDLPFEIGKIQAYGGEDVPEDWVGAYKKVNNEINWRNGNKVIFHLADAGAHGKRFTPSDKYSDEENKLVKEIENCCKKKIKIFGFVIEEDARNSFLECKKIYQSKGGTFEIYDFEKPNFYDYNMNNRSLFSSNKFTNSYGGLFTNISTNNKNTCSLFGNNNTYNNNLFTNNISKPLFDNNNKNNIFSNNKDTSNLFGNNNTDNNNLFTNNISKPLFDNNNKNNIFSNNKNTCSLFGNNNTNNNSLFANNISKPLFDNNNENNIFSNNKNTYSLFGNNNTVNNNLFANNNKNESSSLFGIFNNNNEYGGLFGNNKTVNYFSNNNDMNNRNSDAQLSYQSHINNNFRNLVINSVSNIQNNKI